jgi:hypothetical protein
MSIYQGKPVLPAFLDVSAEFDIIGSKSSKIK